MNFWDWLAANPGVLIAGIVAVIGGIFTLLTRSIIGVFKLGLSFRAQFATKEDQKEFEKEMKKDLRDYKDELLKVVMAASMEIIREKLSDIENIQEMANAMKVTERELEIKIRSAMEKVEEVRSMSDNIRSLNAKVDRLIYGQDQGTMRRKE